MDDIQTSASSSSNRFNPLPIVAVVILVGIIGWMFLSGREKSQPKSQTQTPAQTQPTQTQQAQVTSAPTSTESAVATDSTMTNGQTISVEGGSFYFKPNEIRVKKGQKVTITFTNTGGLHDFVIDELGVKTKQIAAGKSETIEFTPDKTGIFEFYCSVGNHRKMGMKGNLIVE